MSLAAHHHRIVVIHSSSLPSHRRRPIVVVVLDNVNVDVVEDDIVVVVTAVVFHLPIVVVTIAAIIVVGIVVFAVAVTIDIVARPPWLLIQGIRPKQAKAVSPMAWGWSASPWICRRVADGVAPIRLIYDTLIYRQSLLTSTRFIRQPAPEKAKKYTDRVSVRLGLSCPPMVNP